MPLLTGLETALRVRRDAVLPEWFFLDKIFSGRKFESVKRKAKLILQFLLIVSAIQIFAQTPLEKRARFMAVGNKTDADRALKDYYAVISRQLNGQFFAVIDGKVYDMRQSSDFKSGDVQYASDGIVVITEALSHIAIKNYPRRDATEGRHIECCAVRTGTYDWNGTPLELWDCGTMPTAEQMQQVKAAEAKAQEIIDRQTAVLKQAARQKILQGQTNTVHWLLSQATNGDPSAQCNLGEHYLAGLGCETNRDLAIQWLQRQRMAEAWKLQTNWRN
jgi:hypothetical protein